MPTLRVLPVLLLVAARLAAAAPGAQAIADNERAFEQAAIERGTRAGFLEYLAESAVILAPQPVPGRAATESGPAPGAPLRWRPDLASISGGGDFGWASGPFLSYAHSTDELPVAAGHYLTVWHRESDGRWRVALDGGVAYPFEETAVARHLEVTPRLRPTGSGRGRTGDCSAAFASRWQSRGRRAALGEFLAEDARQLSSGRPVLDGRGAWPAGDTLGPDVLVRLNTARSLRAEAGDVEVSFGELDVAARAEVPARHYFYAHVWDVDKRCRLAVEMLNLAR
ncbi:MAG: nuclear transport factor 2 family protein [Proteobacteria bacterium]|nr:nuclear transport factor 2 family protein [Pseudomonadota bacterium]